MPYKDADQKREANRLRQQRFRVKHKGVTEQSSIPPVGVMAKDTDINYRLIYWGGRWIQIII
jgi:hypothetical protein